MTQQVIAVGTNANDNTGDPIRTAFIKTNANFSELYRRPTRSVTTSTSTTEADYYVGVNSITPCTVTLHTPASNGQMIIIKDESGACSQNRITVAGSVDESTSFVLGINSGSISLIYNDKWRII